MDAPLPLQIRLIRSYHLLIVWDLMSQDNPPTSYLFFRISWLLLFTIKTFLTKQKKAYAFS